MAQIDVTDLLVDPDFVDPMTHISRVDSENSYGENIVTECSNVTIGSIQPADGKMLERIPEAERTQDLRNFYMKGRIVASAPGQYTDILVFKGQRFQVKIVQDWTAWGQGWCAGLCVAESPNGGKS